MAKSSINFQKSTVGGLGHNDRSLNEPEYLLPPDFRLKNEVDRSAGDAARFIDKLYKKSADNYRRIFKQKLQAKNYLWEAVVNLNQEHTLEDVQRLAKAIEKETGFTSVQIAIHRDEGYINERGVAQRNLHAHITFFTLDKNTGQQLYRRQITDKQKKQQPNLKPMNRERLSKLQDLTAEVLKMERGKRGSKSVRLTHKQYKSIKKAELAKLKDLKQLNSELRAELKQLKAVRADYAKLEVENKELKEKVKNKELTAEELQLQFNSLSKKLKEQIELRKKEEEEKKRLEAILREKEEEIKEKVLAERENQNKGYLQLKEQLKEKDTFIDKIRRIATKYKNAFEELKSRSESLETAFYNLRKNLESKIEEIKKLKEQLQSKDDEIKQLKEQLQSKPKQNQDEEIQIVIPKVEGRRNYFKM